MKELRRAIETLEEETVYLYGLVTILSNDPVLLAQPAGIELLESIHRIRRVVRALREGLL